MSQEIDVPEVSFEIDPIRLDKLERLRALGRDPFASERFDRTHALGEIREKNASLDGQSVTLAGRVCSLRFPFVELQDESGKGQIFLGDLEAAEFEHLQSFLDLGDFLGISGIVFQTKKGDWAARASKASMLNKSLRQPPFPKVYYKNKERFEQGGLKDVELRYRQRYVDLFVNQDARETLIQRIKVVKAIREYLDSVG
jgi:lysyl-tRNA synthetase, class II